MEVKQLTGNSRVVYSIISNVDIVVYRILALLTIVLFSSLCAVVLLQVFARIFLESSPLWTEELSRYLFIFNIAFAIGIAYRNGEMVAVDMLFDRLTEKNKLIYSLLINFMVIGFILMLLSPSYQFMKIGQFQTSPTLRIGMSYIYISSLILFSNILFFATIKVFKTTIQIFFKEK